MIGHILNKEGDKMLSVMGFSFTSLEAVFFLKIPKKLVFGLLNDILSFKIINSDSKNILILFFFKLYACKIIII